MDEKDDGVSMGDALQIGTCCGIQQAIDYLAESQPRHKNDDMPERIINRFRYIKAKEDGVVPKLNKGKHIKDWYTCGHCGTTLSEIWFDFCPRCGYKILWDSTRCLTGRKKGKNGEIQKETEVRSVE